MAKTVFGAMVAMGMLAGCVGGGPDEPDVQWPPRKPFQLTEREGSIVLARMDYPTNPRTDAFAMFGSRMQGFRNAAACAQGFMPCVAELPPYGDVAFLGARDFLPSATQYDWVGNQMTVGPLIADFQNDTLRDMAFYSARDEQWPEGRVRVSFGGQWADFDRPIGWFPEDFQVTAPQLPVEGRLDLSGPPITFEWTSDVNREIWLWAQGPLSRRLIRVPDNGSYTLDPARLALAPAERVEMGLAAVTTDSVDVDGNQLDMLILSGAGWTGSVCGDFLDVPLQPSGPSGPAIDPWFMGYGFRAILDDGMRDYVSAADGQPRSAEIYFRFYDENLQTLCEVAYDASDAGRRPPLALDHSGPQYGAHRLVPFNGRNGCGPVDANRFGSTDLRDYIEQNEWSFSLGEIVEFEDVLAAFYGPQQWETQRNFMYGVYWSKDGTFGNERGYGYASSMPACFQPVGGPVLGPVAAGRLEPAYYEAFPYLIEFLPR